MISETAHPDAPARTEPDRATADGVIIRRVATFEEYRECVVIQRETWGADFREYVPATILMVTQQLGGVVAGAFARDGAMLGFVFGMAGTMDGRPVHWSDMLAVRPGARGARVGERLKRCQREMARAAGADAMYWTFDPLVARNAHLNLVRLGARVVEYVPNMYGDDTGSPLHGGLPTDRLVAKWDLVPGDGASDVPAIPGPGSRDASPARITVPRDFHDLPSASRATWRVTVREAFLTYLRRGYRVTNFRRADGEELPYYELERAAPSPAVQSPAVQSLAAQSLAAQSRAVQSRAVHTGAPSLHESAQ